MSTRITLTSALMRFLALIALWMFMPTAAHAQCGDIKSSCYKCHQETHPVCGKTEWHSEYGHRYTCWNCHGGNDVAPDKEQAHIGLVRHPLEDAFTSCYPCHPENYQQLAERFARTLGVTVSTREPVPTSAAPRTPLAAQPIVLPPAISTPVAATHSADWLQTLWLLPLVAVMLLAWSVWRRRVA